MIVSLACGSNVAIQNLSTSIDYISRHHSLDLKSVILYLLSKPSPMKNIDDILSMTGPRVLQELDNTNQYVKLYLIAIYIYIYIIKTNK